MNPQDPPTPDDRRLWQQFETEAPELRAPCPDGIDLAGYLDGRLAPDRRVEVESHLAGCPRCLGIVAPAFESASEPEDVLPFAPPHVLEAAKALVPATAVPTSPTRARRWTATWPAGIAATLVMGLVGYHAGTVARTAPDGNGGGLATEMTFGLFDAESPDALPADLAELAGLEQSS